MGTETRPKNLVVGDLVCFPPFYRDDVYQSIDDLKGKYHTFKVLKRIYIPSGVLLATEVCTILPYGLEGGLYCMAHVLVTSKKLGMFDVWVRYSCLVSLDPYLGMVLEEE